MTTRVLGSNLKLAVNMVRKGMGKQALPILNSVLLTCDATGPMTVAMTDLEVIRKANIGVLGDALRVTVNANDFSKMLASVGNNDRVELAVVGNRLLVNSEKTNFSLVCTDGSDFPLIDFDRSLEFQSFTMYAEDFIQLADWVVSGAATDMSRPTLTAIKMEVVSEWKVNAATTDGFRLHMINGVNVKDENDMSGKSILIPAAAIAWLRSTFTKVKPDGDTTVKFTFDGNRIFMDSDSVSLITYAVDGKYPDYQYIVSGSSLTLDPAWSVDFDTLELLAVAREIKRIAGKDNPMMIFALPEYKKNGLYTNDVPVGIVYKYGDVKQEFTINARAKVDMPDGAAFAVNPSFMVDLLSVVAKTHKWVTLSSTNSNGHEPIAVAIASMEYNRTAIVMPMNFNNR